MIKLTSDELDSASAHLWQLLVEGVSDEDARSRMCLDLATYHKVKTHMLDGKAREIRNLPPEHVYVQYVLDQAQNIRTLTHQLERFEATKQYNAMVGAIRLRADLYDRILAKGQECGVIDKQPERHEVIAGIVVADLNNRQLRGHLRRELKAITEMMEGYGDVPFLDVEAGETHHGPKLKKDKRGIKKQRVVG
jgi:hypothetical protein